MLYWVATESVNNTAKSGRPVTVTGKTIVSKVGLIIDNDDRYSIHDIAKTVGISLSQVYFI
jgi:hypothetical protein